VEKFRYLGVEFTSDGRWNREIDTRICGEYTVLSGLYRYDHKTGDFKHRKVVSFLIGLVPILTCGHESLG